MGASEVAAGVGNGFARDDKTAKVQPVVIVALSGGP